MDQKDGVNSMCYGLAQQLLGATLIGESRFQTEGLNPMRAQILALVATMFSLPALADEMVSASAEGVAAISASAVTVVPAPAALALFGAGLAGLVIARRLRKR
jgi:PEP-CTERM motif